MMDKGTKDSVNWRVYTNVNRADPELVKLFKDIPVCPINDVMHRMGACDASLRPVNKTKIVGTALTLKLSLASGSMFGEAIAIAKPGDVIVVTRGGGSTAVASSGDKMVSFAIAQGVKGFIIDGAIRDTGMLEGRDDFNVYSRGISPNGAMNNGIGPGEINVPVACGGIVIFPGDIIVADEDGIVAIRPQDAAEIATLAKALNEKEEKEAKKLMAGEASRSNRAELEKDGCVFHKKAWDE
jgi:regulator of RNase E activity RraA